LIAVMDTPGGEKQIGVARYTMPARRETCEFAIVVADEWQGKGSHAAARAPRGGGARARAAHHDGRHAAARTAHDRAVALVGFETKTDREDPELVQMTLPLR